MINIHAHMHIYPPTNKPRNTRYINHISALALQSKHSPLERSTPLPLSTLLPQIMKHAKHHKQKKIKYIHTYLHMFIHCPLWAMQHVCMWVYITFSTSTTNSFSIHFCLFELCIYTHTHIHISIHTCTHAYPTIHNHTNTNRVQTHKTYKCMLSYNACTNAYKHGNIYLPLPPTLLWTFGPGAGGVAGLVSSYNTVEQDSWCARAHCLACWCCKIKDGARLGLSCAGLCSCDRYCLYVASNLQQPAAGVQ